MSGAEFHSGEVADLTPPPGILSRCGHNWHRNYCRRRDRSNRLRPQSMQVKLLHRFSDNPGAHLLAVRSMIRAKNIAPAPMTKSSR